MKVGPVSVRVTLSRGLNEGGRSYLKYGVRACQAEGTARIKALTQEQA